MKEAGAHVLLTGPHDADGRPTALTLPEQIGKVPVQFNGHVWVDDIWAIGPALRPDFDARAPEDWERLEARLAERRKAGV